MDLIIRDYFEVAYMSDIFISLAVNNDVGNHTGYLCAVDFDDVLSVAATSEPCCYRPQPDKLQIGNRVFPINGYGTYVGNFFWDGVWVDLETANAIANHLRNLAFICEMAEEGLFDTWETADVIDLAPALEAAS